MPTALENIAMLTSPTRQSRRLARAVSVNGRARLANAVLEVLQPRTLLSAIITLATFNGADRSGPRAAWFSPAAPFTATGQGGANDYREVSRGQLNGE